MRFVLTFKTGADVALEIPEADLKRHPETMLSVMSRPRWTGPEGTPEVLRVEAVVAAETHSPTANHSLSQIRGARS